MKTFSNFCATVTCAAVVAALVPNPAWAQTNRYTSQLPQTAVMAGSDFFMVVTGTPGAYGTRLIQTTNVQNLPGWPACAATNGFVDARVTNGLSTIPYVQAQIQAATNSLAMGGVPGGLVTNNSPASVVVAGAGVLSVLATNSVSSPNVIAATVSVTSSLTGPGSLSLTNPVALNIFGGQVVAALLNSSNVAGTNNLAGNVNIGGNLTAANVVPLQSGYVPYTNLNPIVFANWVQFTNAINGNTNAVAPANTSTIRAWVNFTNLAGGVFKLPLYQ